MFHNPKKSLKMAMNFGIFIFMAVIDLSGQVYGCKDVYAINYDPAVTINDGSCVYEDVIADPVDSFVMSEIVVETSGLIIWDDKIWKQNESDYNNLYAIDTLNGSIIMSYRMEGLQNTDWEEISQDDNYIYIGDTGNNRNGNRTDLKILRIDKNSILAGDPQADTISFSYSGQSDLSLQVRIIPILTVKHSLFHQTVSIFLQNNGKALKRQYIQFQRCRAVILHDSWKNMIFRV